MCKDQTCDTGTGKIDIKATQKHEMVLDTDIEHQNLKRLEIWYCRTYELTTLSISTYPCVSVGHHLKELICLFDLAFPRHSLCSLSNILSSFLSSARHPSLPCRYIKCN
jgi:hypothetical protein